MTRKVNDKALHNMTEEEKEANLVEFHQMKDSHATDVKQEDLPIEISQRESEVNANKRSVAVRWTFTDEKLEAFRNDNKDFIEEYFDIGIRYDGKEYRFNVKDLKDLIPEKDVIEWKEKKD